MPLPPSFSAPQSSPPKAGLLPPAVILGTSGVHAEGGTTGVSGIQRNKGNHHGTPAKHQQGLTGEKRLRLPPGTSRTMLPPPAVTPAALVPASEDGAAPPAVTPAALVPASEGGAAPSRRHSRHPGRPCRRRDDWGVGNPEKQRQPPWHSR